MATPDSRSPEALIAQAPKLETWNAPKDSMERTLWPKDSMASSPHTFHNALIAALEFIKRTEGKGAQVTVDMESPEATRWKSEAARLKTELADPAVKSLFDSRAADNAAEINKYLSSKWFSITLRENGKWLYVASVFKQQVEWSEKGKKVPLNYMDDPNRPIEWVEMNKGWVTKYKSGNSDVFELQTRNGDRVYLMPSGNVSTTPIDLYQRIRQIHEGKSGWAPGNDLRFPKVSLDEKWSIDWIVGAQVWSYTVNQAEYQNKLQMDENGAVAEAAVAMWMTRSISMPRVDTINSPFYVWFVRKWNDGKDVITFAARIGENAMAKK